MLRNTDSGETILGTNDRHACALRARSSELEDTLGLDENSIAEVRDLLIGFRFEEMEKKLGRV